MDHVMSLSVKDDQLAMITKFESDLIAFESSQPLLEHHLPDVNVLLMFIKAELVKFKEYVINS